GSRSPAGAMLCTFTGDSNALSAWLRKCNSETVAMEATGVYWIPAFQILEAAGFEVCLVDPRYFQNFPGRRTDVSDCQWLQRLHSVVLLRASFRPAQEVFVLRSLRRHRDNLIRRRQHISCICRRRWTK